MNQSLIFRAPVRAGDTVHATVTVKEIIFERNCVVLQTTCTVKGIAVIEGEALVKVGSRRPGALRANSATEERGGMRLSPSPFLEETA
jgi:3-hydroxybutyryl-CoA dehydratase